MKGRREKLLRYTKKDLAARKEHEESNVRLSYCGIIVLAKLPEFAVS